MAILEKITWFIIASSKRKHIMKSVMKDEGQVAVQFCLMYDQEEGLFNQEKRLLQTLTGEKMMTVTVNYGHPKMSDKKLAKNLYCRLNCFYNVF